MMSTLYILHGVGGGGFVRCMASALCFVNEGSSLRFFHDNEILALRYGKRSTFNFGLNGEFL
jgi:hypothetical protein